MVQLVKALKDSKAKKVSPFLDKIRHQMGSHRLFSQRTEDIYFRLGTIDSFLESDSKNATNFFEQGHFKFHLGKNDEAIALFNKAILLNSQFVEAYKNRGTARKDKGDLAGAIKDLTEAIRLDPLYTKAHCSRGTARANKGNFAGAIKDLNEAIRLDPQNADFYCNRGIARSRKGDYKEALLDFNKTISLRSKYALVYSNRGALKCDKLKDFEGAIEDFTKTIQLNPNYSVAYLNRGFAKYNKGDKTKAKADFQLFIELTKNRQRFKNQHEWIYKQFSDLKK